MDMISPPNILIPKSTCGCRWMEKIILSVQSKLKSTKRMREKLCSFETFSNKDTTMLAKHGKVGTRGFKVTRGAANTCKSTN